MEDHKQEVETLQRKVSELQADYKVELKKAKDLSEVCSVGDDAVNVIFLTLYENYCIGVLCSPLMHLDAVVKSLLLHSCHLYQSSAAIESQIHV